MSTRILIVDDEESVVFALERYLRREGFAVDSAGGLVEARACLERASYALVLADLRLSGAGAAEGFELLDEVRERHAGTRSILLTAYGSPALEREALERGAALVLAKPQPLAEVVRAIRKVLNPPPPVEAAGE